MIVLGIVGIGWGIFMVVLYLVIGDFLIKFEREVFMGRYYGFFEVICFFLVFFVGMIGGVIVDFVGENYRVFFLIGVFFVFFVLLMVWMMKNFDVEGGKE